MRTLPDWLKLSALLLPLSVAGVACSSDGGGDSFADAKQSDDDDMDEDERRVQEARASWPDYTGDAEDTVDLSGYSVVTLVPFANLTDNSRDDDAGETFVDEVEDALEDRYEDVFEQIRVADEPLGRDDEVVLRGQVYDFSKGGGYNPWTGRSKAKFKAELSLTNGATNEVLKSSRIKESGYSDNESQLEDAARGVAKMIAKSKTSND